MKKLSGQSANEGQWFRQLIDGQIIASPDTLCQKINEFFIGLTSSFTPLSPADVNNIEVGEVPHELLVTTHEASLHSVQVKKVEGPDQISNVVLKMFAFDLALVIANIHH